MVSIDEAIELISKERCKLRYEIIPIEEAIERVSAEEIDSLQILPPFNSSAMDGYAVKLEDLGKEVIVVDKILAGDINSRILLKNQAIKIMTGAVVPEGTDIIIPKENIEKRDENRIVLPKNFNKRNIRERGEDVGEGETLLRVGERINAFSIALLASQGITHIRVFRKPKITIFASGSELKLHYEKREKSQIYNSNTPLLISRVKELGCEVKFIGKAEDSLEAIREFILNSLDSDLIITSGGVSVGDADFTKEAFDKCGFKTIFSKVNIKPGKPTTFGKIGETFILNLPGNPLACALNFEIFGRIIISKLIGVEEIYQNYIDTKIGNNFSHKKGKNSLIPGFFDGKEFFVTDKFSPAMVNVLNRGNGFILVDREIEELKKGDRVKFIPTLWEFRSKTKVDIYTKGSKEF